MPPPLFTLVLGSRCAKHAQKYASLTVTGFGTLPCEYGWRFSFEIRVLLLFLDGRGVCHPDSISIRPDCCISIYLKWAACNLETVIKGASGVSSNMHHISMCTQPRNECIQEFKIVGKDLLSVVTRPSSGGWSESTCAHPLLSQACLHVHHNSSHSLYNNSSPTFCARELFDGRCLDADACINAAACAHSAPPCSHDNLVQNIVPSVVHMLGSRAV